MTESHITGNQAELVATCQKLMSHAWMVRTFIKHSDEAEDFPELMQMARAIFDTSRALETCVAEPAKYIRMLQKKLPKLHSASRQFKVDAMEASTHTNFQQAVISIETALAEMQSLLESALQKPKDNGKETANG